MLRSLFYTILNLLIPPRTLEARVLSLTLEELEDIKRNNGLPYHDKRVTALIWELKYRASTHALLLAGALLSEDLLEIAEEELGRVLLIPIPMHEDRRLERGYNQTELLCKAALNTLSNRICSGKGPRISSSGRRASGEARPFSQESSVFEYSPDLLERTRHTPRQQTLARTKRLKNVKNSMCVVDPAKVRGRVCVVVDDVSTTGATLAEAERALKCAGARKIYTVALARS